MQRAVSGHADQPVRLARLLQGPIIGQGRLVAAAPEVSRQFTVNAMLPPRIGRTRTRDLRSISQILIFIRHVDKSSLPSFVFDGD